MMSRRWRHWLPWRCLLLAAAITLGLCVAWSGWRHWLLAEQHHAQVGEQLARQRQALAALTQRQGQLAHEQPLWRALRQRGWLATENRLRALEALQALRDGQLTATVAQKPERMGALAVDLALKALRQEPVPAFVLVELELIEGSK